MGDIDYFEEEDAMQTTVGRVYQEPDGNSVLLLLLKAEDRGILFGSTFMRVEDKPETFKIGDKVFVRGLMAWKNDGSRRMLKRTGATFTEYRPSGKIVLGG